MAFFNLWSSERLSFSLSIIAVISAAITSYYQFFFEENSVAVFKTSLELNWTADSSALEVKTRCLIQNQGTSDIAVQESGIFFCSNCLEELVFEDPPQDKVWWLENRTLRENLYYNARKDKRRYSIHDHVDSSADKIIAANGQDFVNFETLIDTTRLNNLLAISQSRAWFNYDSLYNAGLGWPERFLPTDSLVGIIWGIQMKVINVNSYQSEALLWGGGLNFRERDGSFMLSHKNGPGGLDYMPDWKSVRPTKSVRPAKSD